MDPLTFTFALSSDFLPFGFFNLLMICIINVLIRTMCMRMVYSVNGICWGKNCYDIRKRIQLWFHSKFCTCLCGGLLEDKNITTAPKDYPFDSTWRVYNWYTTISVIFTSLCDYILIIMTARNYFDNCLQVCKELSPY